LKIKNRKEAELILNEFIEDYGTKQFLLKNLYWIDSLNNKLAWRFNLKVITQKYELIGAAVPNFISEISTLIIKGELSDYISQSDSEQYFIRFPKNKLITIKGAGHWVHAEKPKEFFDCVSDFITN
jgi:pimeloyl-ACP methyl ester carboxylesterase